MILRRPFLLFTFALFPLLLFGCDSVGGNEGNGGSSAATTGVYVANQGNFGDGNGSVTIYDPRSRQSETTAVQGLNSTVQSIVLGDTSLYVMSNTAARIDVFSTDGLSQTAQVTSVNSPRYAALSGRNTAYVTDQSPFGSAESSAVRVLDLETSRIVASIRVSGTPEGITTTETRAYTALGAFSDTSLVAALDLSRNTLIEEIDVGCYSRDLSADSDGDVYAFCSNRAEAVVLDAESGNITSRLSLPDTAETVSGVGQPVSYSADAQELHVATDSGILRIDTESNEIGPMIDVGLSSAPGAVAYSASQQQLYVARVPTGTAGFTTQGHVTIHDRNGEQTGSFVAGIAPTYIAFRRGE